MLTLLFCFSLITVGFYFVSNGFVNMFKMLQGRSWRDEECQEWTREVTHRKDPEMLLKWWISWFPRHVTPLLGSRLSPVADPILSEQARSLVLDPSEFTGWLATRSVFTGWRWHWPWTVKSMKYMICLDLFSFKDNGLFYKEFRTFGPNPKARCWGGRRIGLVQFVCIIYLSCMLLPPIDFQNQKNTAIPKPKSTSLECWGNIF